MKQSDYNFIKAQERLRAATPEYIRKIYFNGFISSVGLPTIRKKK